MHKTCLLLCLFFSVSSEVLASTCPPGSGFEPGNDVWQVWGGNHGNTRSNSYLSNLINSATLPRLTLKWAYGFKDVRSVIGNPALSGNRFFIGDENGKVYLLDRDSSHC